MTIIRPAVSPRIAKLRAGTWKSTACIGSAGQPRSDDSKYRAESEQSKGQREELAADLLRPRPQGHAHTNLAAALGHGVAQHAIAADAVSKSAIPEKRPASTVGERRATRLLPMRVSIDRRSLTAARDRFPEQPFCKVSARDSGGRAVRAGRSDRSSKLIDFLGATMRGGALATRTSM
jgi:hypothetical protein